MVPGDDLLAAGFPLHAPAPVDPVALREELAQIRAEHALAEARFGQQLVQAEAEHLRPQLAEQGERIEDSQRAVAALIPAPEQAALAPPAGPAVPGQTQAEPGPENSGPRRRWVGRAILPR
ncbi:hypothetical protein [Streptomyces sp. NPDC057686]|uniref:hypothetical protein n=1 Tax=Streptomyces sp. NPDC057686 TaxID=3346212 RepID=UPI00368FBCCB